jgi:hypothetical protein
MSAKTTYIPKQQCLKCGKNLSGAAAPFQPTEDAKPGDLAMCMFCGAVMRMDENLVVRALTEGELAALTNNGMLMAQITRARNAMQAIKAEQN